MKTKTLIIGLFTALTISGAHADDFVIDSKYKVGGHCNLEPERTTNDNTGTGRLAIASCMCDITRISDGATTNVMPIEMQFLGNVCYDNEPDCDTMRLNWKKTLIEGCETVCPAACRAAVQDIWFSDILQGDDPRFDD